VAFGPNFGRPRKEEEQDGGVQIGNTSPVSGIAQPGGGRPPGAASQTQPPPANQGAPPITGGARDDAIGQLDDAHETITGGGVNTPNAATNPTAQPGPGDYGSAASAPSSVDDTIEDFVAGNFNMPDDTAASQAIAQQQQDRLLGRNLLQQRARIGRAGMGFTGVAGALANDARSQAALDLASQMDSVREREQNQSHDFGMDAADLDIRKSEAANREAILRAQADMITQILGGAPEGAATGGQSAGAFSMPGFGAIEDATQAPDLAASGVPSSQEDALGLERVDAPPEGAEMIQSYGTGPDAVVVYRVERTDGSGYDYVRTGGG
jgi:hypothetical protein